MSDGPYLFVNRSDSRYARLISINKTNNSVINEIEQYLYSVGGAVITPPSRRIIGRSTGFIPADITFVSYGDDGKLLGGGDSPYHGSYPGASKVWSFPSGTRVVDNAGIVYNASDLTYLNSFGGAIDNIAFYSNNIPIVLRGSTLVSFTDSILPSGSFDLGFSPKAMVVAGTNVVLFTPDASTPFPARVDLVSVSAIGAPKPGPAVNPGGLAYNPDHVFLDKSNVLYLLSRSHQSLFRWDTVTQRYLETWSLIEAPSFVAYSPTNDAIYLAYPSGLIRRISMLDTNHAETPFASLPQRPIGLAAAGEYIFAADPSGAWGTHYTFSKNGQRISSKDWNYYSAEYIWSQANRRMYFFRDDSSPNDLHFEVIGPSGTIDSAGESPLHGEISFAHPIRVSGNGQFVLLGGGHLFNGTTLSRLSSALANSITDAAWIGSTIRSVRTVSLETQFQKWDGASFNMSAVKQVPGEAYRLVARPDGNLVAVSMLQGMPTFYVMSDSFGLLPPSSLYPPVRVHASVQSSSLVRLQWDDVSGELDYVIQRKAGAGGEWMEIGTSPTSIANFEDRSVSMGQTYFYRVLARNEMLLSSPSSEVEASVRIPLAPQELTATPAGAFEIQLAWSRSQLASSNLIERALSGSSGWTKIAQLNGESTSFRDSNLTPGTTFSYRVRAMNGLGFSDYSNIAEAQTDLVPPTPPSGLYVGGLEPFAIRIYWQPGLRGDRQYLERRAGSSGAWINVAVLPGNATTHRDSNLLKLTAYEYRLSSSNRLGRSAYSGVLQAQTSQVPPPSTPAGLSARPTSSSSVLVSWFDSAWEEEYQLERSSGDGLSWARVATLGADQLAFMDTNVLEGVRYLYRARAFNEVGASFYSNIDDATPQLIVNIFEDHFVSSYKPEVWSSISGGTVTNGGQGFDYGAALWFGGKSQRIATTRPVAILPGSYLEFKFRGGNSSVDGTN
ncbi:MAG: fibronectin type III domain-containing protein [Verrucomicrobia bacterium]|nr:fibronectin type III domain-containing protein [Verrucomicrobiota bacterium]